MGLFKPDLYRNFAIGFALGAMAVGAQVGSAHWETIAPAVAAILPL